MNREELLQKFKEPIKVGPAGFVRLCDVMGDDSSIVQAARCSYGAGTKTVSDDRTLIRYLLRHSHTTPFEMCEIKLHIRIPMDTHRQLIRQRAASVNEYSTRYSLAIDDVASTHPTEWRLQSTNNKQGSDGTLEEWTYLLRQNINDLIMEDFDTPGEYLSERESKSNLLAREVYEEALSFGVAREVARKNLPLSTYTELYWKIDLHNLFNFLRQRLDSHAQLEIREFAQAMAEIIKEWCPVAWEAFVDYKLEAKTFSKQELAIIRELLIVYEMDSGYSFEDAFDLSKLSKREQSEFMEKIK